jgi:hypothetical protein
LGGGSGLGGAEPGEEGVSVGGALGVDPKEVLAVGGRVEGARAQHVPGVAIEQKPVDGPRRGRHPQPPHRHPPRELTPLLHHPFLFVLSALRSFRIFQFFSLLFVQTPDVRENKKKLYFLSKLSMEMEAAQGELRREFTKREKGWMLLALDEVRLQHFGPFGICVNLIY